VLPPEITYEKPSFPQAEVPPKAIEKAEAVEIKHTPPPPPPPHSNKSRVKAKPNKKPFNYEAKE
jgi:hypothetical protein